MDRLPESWLRGAQAGGSSVWIIILQREPQRTMKGVWTSRFSSGIEAITTPPSLKNKEPVPRTLPGPQKRVPAFLCLSWLLSADQTGLSADCQRPCASYGAGRASAQV